MSSALRSGIGIVLSCCGAAYGAIAGACVCIWLLGAINNIVHSEGFGIIALLSLGLVIPLSAIVGLVIGAWAGWKSFPGLGTLTAQAGVSPQLAERRRHVYRPLAVVAGAGAFLTLHHAIAVSLIFIGPDLHLVRIPYGQPFPLVLSVPLTMGTLLASAAIGAGTWQSLERRFLGRALAANAAEPDKLTRHSRSSRRAWYR